jgi:hypothetical protein
MKNQSIIRNKLSRLLFFLLVSLAFSAVWSPSAAVEAHGTPCYVVSALDLTCPILCTNTTCNTNINCIALCGLGNAHAMCDFTPPGQLARCVCACNP